MFSPIVYRNYIFDKRDLFSAKLVIFPLRWLAILRHMETFLGFVWLVALFGICFVVVHAAIWLAKRK